MTTLKSSQLKKTLHPNTVTYIIKLDGDIVTITFDVLNAIDYYNKI